MELNIYMSLKNIFSYKNLEQQLKTTWKFNLFVTENTHRYLSRMLITKTSYASSHYKLKQQKIIEKFIK